MTVGGHSDIVGKPLLVLLGNEMATVTVCHAATVDLAPDVTHAALAGRGGQRRGKLSLGNWLRRVLGDPVNLAARLESQSKN